MGMSAQGATGILARAADPRTNWKRTIAALLLLGLSASAGAQGPRVSLPMSSTVMSPGALQIEQLQDRLNAAQSDQERYQLLMQLIPYLERLRATVEVSEVYEQLFQLPLLAEPATRFLWVIRFGNYLEGQARPEQAARVYERFIQEFDPEGQDLEGRYRAELQLRLLSALIQAGEYRRAKPMAFAILDATGTASPLPLLGPLLELAESDRLTIPELERLESLLLDQPQAYALLPRLLRLYVNQGRSQKAVDLLDELLIEHPDFFLSQLDMAQEIYTGFLQEAAAGYLLERLDSLSERRPEDPVYPIIRVRWLDRVGRTEEATAFLEQQPKDRLVFQQERASFYFRHGRYDSAAEAYLQLLRNDPQNQTYHRRLGECFYQQGRRQEAALIWERIPAAAGKSLSSYLTLAEIYKQHGEYPKAIAALKEARGLSQANELDLLTRILDLRVEAGDDEALLREYLESCRLQDMYEGSFRARILEQVTSAERMRSLQEILQRHLADDEDPLRRQQLSLLATDLWVALGEYERAIDFIRSAYANTPELGLRLYMLGLELSRGGQPEQAIAAWSAVPRENRYFYQTRERMAQLSLHTGRWEDARQAALELVSSLFERRRLRPPAAGRIEAASFEPYLSTFTGPDERNLGSALSILAQANLEERQPGEALESLLLLEKLPQRNRPGLLPLLFGHAYSQLGSVETAQAHYEQAVEQALPGSAEETEAQYFLTECLLWQDNSLEAMERYLHLARSAPRGDFANDALRRYLVVAFAAADQLYHYSLATLFEWKGDLPEAIRLYREAAADESEGDVAGWCLYEVCRLLITDSQDDAARRQISHVLERYNHPTLQAECRVLLSRLSESQPAGLTTEATGPYLDLILQHPDSLYSDLARLKLEGRLEQPF